MAPEIAQATALTRILCGEFFKALGFNQSGWITSAFSPLVRNPIHRFSEIAVGFDQRVSTTGFQHAAEWILPNFIKGVTIEGNLDIPKSGPLLVASNHPGAYDALVIASQIPRDDLKIIVNLPLDFIQTLPSTLQHFIYAPPDPHIRIGVIRSALQHLKCGGALLLFASGGIDPDPASMEGASQALNKWSRSIEIFLDKVPDTQLLLSMISGILIPKYVHHLFTHFRKERSDRQRIAEFFQVIRQMLSPGKYLQQPKISFADPIKLGDLIQSEKTEELMPALIKRAKQLLADHLSA